MKSTVLRIHAYSGMVNLNSITGATIILFLCFFVYGKANGLIVKQKKVLITIVDLKTRKPIENASVFMYFIKSNGVDVVNYSAKTNNYGQSTISYEVCDNLGFSVRTTKDGFYQCFSTNANSDEVSAKNFTTDIYKNITLYLTSDVQQLLDYYSSITPHFQIDTLIRLLKANGYGSMNRGCLPELKWEDIPKLLEIGNDETRITSHAVNPLSSYWQKDCLLGIYSLWLIESIRVSEGNPIIGPGERFPSLNPILREKSNPGGRGTQVITETTCMNAAFHAYLNWWKKVKTQNPSDACKINPLENTNISW